MIVWRCESCGVTEPVRLDAVTKVAKSPNGWYFADERGGMMMSWCSRACVDAWVDELGVKAKIDD